VQPIWQAPATAASAQGRRGAANTSSCVVPTVGAGDNMELKALLEDGKEKLQAPDGFAHVENIIDANGRTSVSRHNDSSLSVIVNGAGVNSKTVNNITCGTNITVNYTSSLSKTMVKEMVKEELRKGMESISK
jgi:primosomal replication protein N